MKNGKPQEIINLNLNRLQNRGSNQPTGIDFQKYIHFLMEKRRWLIIITAAVGVLWILFYSLFKDRLVKYETVATIRFDNLDKASAIREFDVTGIEGKLAILTTKNFLGRVSDSLDFQIAFEKEALSNKTFVRDSFIPSDDPPYGAYQIEYSGNQFSLLYTSPDKSVEDKTVQSGVVREGSPIQLRYRGFYLDLESSILESYPDLRFHLIPRVLAANAIAKNFVFYLRSQSILDITYTHRDPEFSAKVCNTIARTFVQQLLEYKRNQTSSVLTSLEEQLRVARKDLEGSERELQTFREANPTITLRDESKRVVDELTTYESRYQDLKTVETGLDNLIAKGGSAASKEERLYAYQEIIDYLKFHKQPGMEGIQLQYQDLLEEREKYKRTNYLPNSPEMRKVDQSLAELQGLVDQRVTDYKSGIANFSERNRREIYSIRSDLQRLPQNELKLAELQRDREIKEKILTSVQLRFNEARVSDAAIIPDAYIIDEAYPPLVTGGLSTDLKYWLIGPVLGFMLGVALFLGLAFFDNTVKGTSETEQKLGLPVWATVPTIVLDESALPANGSRQ
ncbi:MAG TPA: hypothetical protein PKV71_12630, partial [Calditrichia bacterium]|nr:hypothetical protein [Calditrichia bacterium]